MKVDVECYVCLIERGIRAAIMAGADREKILEVARRISRLLVDSFNFDTVPAVIGTLRERIIAEVLGVEDPYRNLKEHSNRLAAGLSQRIFSRIDLSDHTYATFRKVMAIAAAANAVEWFIRGDEFDLERLGDELAGAEERLMIDDTMGLYNALRGRRILYILDNAGEAVIDREVLRYLRGLADRVYVAARSKPVLNDITVDEALHIGIGDICDGVVPVGDFVGVIMEWATEEFRRIVNSVDVIVAKGMGAYETLTEYSLQRPTFVLLKAKCRPIARSLGIPQGMLAIKRLE